MSNRRVFFVHSSKRTDNGIPVFCAIENERWFFTGIILESSFDLAIRQCDLINIALGVGLITALEIYLPFLRSESFANYLVEPAYFTVSDVNRYVAAHVVQESMER